MEDSDKTFFKMLKNIHSKFGAGTLTAVKLFIKHTNFDFYIHTYE